MLENDKNNDGVIDYQEFKSAMLNVKGKLAQKSAMEVEWLLPHYLW